MAPAGGSVRPQRSRLAVYVHPCTVPQQRRDVAYIAAQPPMRSATTSCSQNDARVRMLAGTAPAPSNGHSKSHMHLNTISERQSVSGAFKVAHCRDRRCFGSGCCARLLKGPQNGRESTQRLQTCLRHLLVLALTSRRQRQAVAQVGSASHLAESDEFSNSSADPLHWPCIGMPRHERRTPPHTAGDARGCQTHKEVVAFRSAVTFRPA